MANVPANRNDSAGVVRRASIRTERELADWNVEESYWRENWQTRPYAAADRSFDFYRAAYRYGFETAQRNGGHDFNDVEHALRAGWDAYEYRSAATWEAIHDAVRDGWNRLPHRPSRSRSPMT